MRRLVTALFIAGLASLAPDLAAGAPAPAASSFEIIPRPHAAQPAHRGAWLVGAAGITLIAASFPMAREADRRYDAYVGESDPSRLDARFAATTRMDRIASASLWTGEALLVTAVWLRFVREPKPNARVSLAVEPARCAVLLHF